MNLGLVAVPEHRPGSLVVLLQQEAVEKIDIYERRISKTVKETLDSIPIARHDTLTRLELEILMLKVQGMRSIDIAVQRKCSAKTIQAHLEHMRVKLGLATTQQLILYAFKVAFQRSAP